MRILYTDCFLNFDTSMLLGALADAGADMTSVENEIKSLCPDTLIKLNHVKRCEIEAVRADVIVPTSAEAVEAKDILNFTENFTASCEYYTALSKTAKLCGESLSKFSPTFEIDQAVLTNEICTAYAVLSVLKEFNVEFVICSKAKNSSEAYLPTHAIIPKKSKHTQIDFSLLWNEAFLSVVANDYGIMPEMEVLKIGYGAGVENLDTPNIIRAVLGEQHSIDAENFYEFTSTEFGVIA